ncbi:MAG: hypothetical protein ACI915_004300, partial [Gammaproteobacteria bacterium]
MNGVGLLFAYIFAGYFVAEKLRQFEAAALTILYTAVLPFPAYFSSSSAATLRDLSRGYYSAYKGDET